MFEPAGIFVRSNWTKAALPDAIFMVTAVPKFEVGETALM
jgi:hypothetical protein